MTKLAVIFLLLFPLAVMAQSESKKTIPTNPFRTVAPEPLYVIDGKIIKNADVVRDSTQSIVSINSIKPQDIQSIEVLKGPKAIEAYGDAGKNGVLIFTTNASAQKSKNR